MRNLGVGTSSPTAYLHVRERDSEGASQLFTVERTVNNFPGPGFMHFPVIHALSSGNVGIGTYAPTTKLHVNGGNFRIEDNMTFLDMGIIAGSNPFARIRTNGQYISFDQKCEFEGLVQLNDRLIISNTIPGQGDVQLALNADGTIRAREVKVDLITIPDYVFSEDYDLMPLEELREFIDRHHHLPNVKSEAEFQKEGSYPLGEMNLKLLEKVEELTLYIIKLEERIEKIENDE